jgi:hypothetical protein
MVIIDGITYNVPVVRLTRRADFLDKYAERTEDGVLHREMIGVYFNYQLEFGSSASPAEYAALWQKLTEPVEFHTVTVPDAGGSHTFTAYFSNVGDELRRVRDAEAFWKSLTVNFIAREPARS